MSKRRDRLQLYMFSVLISSIIGMLSFSNIANANENFERVWSFSKESNHPTNTVQAPAQIYKDTVLTVDLDGFVNALDLVSGELKWSKKIGKPPGRRGFYINEDNGLMYINAGRSLYVLDTKNGDLKNKIKIGFSIVEPLVLEGDAIVFDTRGNIQRINIEEEDLVWNLSLGNTARIWSPPNISKDNKIAYVATSNPGGLLVQNREIDGIDYSSSIVAIDLDNGEVIFSYKDVFKDVWDFDVLGRPLLLENYETDDGKIIDVVFQLTKTGNVIAINAKDGTEIYEGQTKLVDVDTYGVEGLSDFQRDYLWPERFSEISLTENDLRLSDIAPFKLRHAKFGEFIPPSLDYDVVIKGLHGGAEWFGGKLYEHDSNDYLAVPYNDYTFILRVEYEFSGKKDSFIYKTAKKLSWLMPDTNFTSKIKTFYKEMVLGEKNVPLDSSEKSKVSNSEYSHRWNQNEWSRSSTQSWLKKEKNYYETHPDLYYKLYDDTCSGCHYKSRTGDYQSELSGDGYIPGLIGYTLTKKFEKFKSIDSLNSIHKNNFGITQTEYDDMNSFFKRYDEKELEEGRIKPKGFWQMLAAKDGEPASKGPWGGLALINMSSGKIDKKILLGDMENKENVGLPVFGGISTPSSNNLIVATGTPDEKAFIIDLNEQKVIQKIQLDYAGSAPPLLKNVNGCEVIVFMETGGRFSWYKKKNGLQVSLYKRDSCKFN